LVLLKWLLWVHAGKLNSASLKVQYFPVCKGQGLVLKPIVCRFMTQL